MEFYKFFVEKLFTGLPDGIFSYDASQFGYILEGLRMENVDIFRNNFRQFGVFYINLVHFISFWCILRSFDIFLPVLLCCSKKNLATL
jgi:hypothetical protein